MNFSQLHEQLRIEILRRIERGVLSGTLLARQAGLKPAHISNFLHQKRHLSLASLDRVLDALSMRIEDLLSAANTSADRSKKEPRSLNRVPLVTQTMAIFEAQMRTSSVLELIQLPKGYLDHLQARRASDKKTWDRFVAVRASYTQAEAMLPVIAPHAILVIDRHYNSFTPYHPHTPNVYAIQRGNVMVFRYATLHGNNVVLRPHRIEHPVELIEIKEQAISASVIIGRICVSISEV